ncbi:MAG: sugar ABC transporter substrate-binding protein [Clostridiales bacterium]|nr:sugar ABC transporter substrate-binding protein [Clostridiales bacterium]
MNTNDIKKPSINKRKLISFIVFLFSILLLFSIIFGMNYYRKQLIDRELNNSQGDTKYYSKHFALIIENLDSPFGESIYGGARAKGDELGIYVENFGENLHFPYSIKERLKMAIASGVHGIIIQANGDDETTKYINQATAAGIPVVTVLEDAPISERISFVGANQYQLGKYYGNQILKSVSLLNKEQTRVVVLLGANEKNKGSDIIFTGIKDSLAKETIELEPVAIDRQSAFSSEETIHKIIMDKDKTPDIIVCLNQADTISAYQTIVDYNMVGDIDIIGYYNSEVIQLAIEKNIIDSTIVIDTKQIGEYSVKILDEYLTFGMISEYIPISIDIVE